MRIFPGRFYTLLSRPSWEFLECGHRYGFSLCRHDWRAASSEAIRDLTAVTEPNRPALRNFFRGKKRCARLTNFVAINVILYVITLTRNAVLDLCIRCYLSHFSIRTDNKERDTLWNFIRPIAYNLDVEILGSCSNQDGKGSLKYMK